MRDEIFDRSYQNGREELHTGLDRLLGRIAHGVRVTFEAIHRVEWSAPWQKDSTKDRTGLA